MLDRRQFFFGLLAVAAAPIATDDAFAAQKKEKKTRRKKKKSKKFVLDPKYRPQSVKYRSGQKRGTVIVDTGARYLYLVTGRNTARRYGVGVGRDALAWSGTAVIGAKKEWPEWRPTDEMIQREPEKYGKYADGMPGGKGNPLGARALYLFDGGYDTFYRIHGTTQPSSIGTASSNGCIRMTNESVIDLYGRVPIGTKVIVM